MPAFTNPHAALRHHVSGAIARGEKEAVTAQESVTTFARNWSDAEGDAFNAFCEMVSAAAGLTFDQAATVFDVYRKARALKFDRTNRRYVVTHGALLDRAVLRSHAGAEVAR